MITRLHVRAAVLVTVGAFLLFTAIPVVHAVTAAPDHHSDQCPVCQTLQHDGNLLPADTATLAAADFLPVATVCCPDVFVPTGVSARAHHTRAPPVA